MLWPAAHVRTSDARQAGGSAGGVAVATASRTGRRGTILGAPVMSAAVGPLAFLELPEGYTRSSFEEAVARRRVRPREAAIHPGVPAPRPLERGRTGTGRGGQREPGRLLGRSCDPLQECAPRSRPEINPGRATPRGEHDCEGTTADIRRLTVRGSIPAPIGLWRGLAARVLVIGLDAAANQDHRHHGGEDEHMAHPPSPSSPKAS